RALVRAGGAGAAAAVWACLPPAIAATSVDAAVEELLAGRARVESPYVHLDLPQRFDYGNTVPLAVAVDSPMAEAEHVRRVHVFAAGNPFPEVASFHFTPANGRASASTRIRLNEGMQDVVAVAELSDGRTWLSRRAIEVGISGCSSETGVSVGQLMPRPEPRLKLPAEARRDEIVEIRTMISHWMETGLRSDAAGNPIPRRIINRMVCLHGGERVFAADLTPAIAANAYLGFPMIARESAELTFIWYEDGGGEYRASHSLTVI
ncbi:MAG TPA: thiosulfate oxidation carrier protein SoxY, partial [Geminicoccaceae bacterium]|nr:thiosulfate oxidation carrier protein SoxY [Geminicoccaceae bacterium]